MILRPIGYGVYVYLRHLIKYYDQAPKSRYTRYGLRYMYTQVRERCMIENELQSGYCGNEKFVAGHKRAFSSQFGRHFVLLSFGKAETDRCISCVS
jgi:hypothetical protein